MSVEPYNFRKPGRLASDLEQRLAAWLRDSCALGPDRWVKHMPFRLEMAPQGLEIVRPGEGLGRLPEAAVGYRMTLGEEGLLTLLVFARPLALALVAGMLGDPVGELPADRELTVIEDSLCEYVVQGLLVPVLQEAWPGREPLRLALEKKEPNPRRTRLFPPEQNVIVCTFGAQGPFGEQPWYWLLPQKGLLELFARPGPEQDGPQEAVRPRLELLVRELPVEVTVSLGTVELPLSYLAGLRAGDVIVLNQRVSEPLPATVAGQRKYRVWPGRVGSRQAFRIASVIES